MRDMCIAAGHLESDYPHGANDDVRIELFFERIDGWILGIADQCINGGDKGIPHSGFAVLAMVFSYFEFIAKCQAGYRGSDLCGDYFKQGVRSVFPELQGTSEGELLLRYTGT